MELNFKKISWYPVVNHFRIKPIVKNLAFIWWTKDIVRHSFGEVKSTTNSVENSYWFIFWKDDRHLYDLVRFPPCLPPFWIFIVTFVYKVNSLSIDNNKIIQFNETAYGHTILFGIWIAEIVLSCSFNIVLECYKINSLKRICFLSLNRNVFKTKFHGSLKKFSTQRGSLSKGSSVYKLFLWFVLVIW